MQVSPALKAESFKRENEIRLRIRNAFLHSINICRFHLASRKGRRYAAAPVQLR